uniref:Ninein isoform X1 n=1 Tax=Pogona vitticeps TaxID=103695 RepID=A0ABM5FC83_9SAUR
MDEAEQDQYEAHLKELFDSFDVTGAGSLGQEELTELCRVLHLEEVAPGALQQTLAQDGLPSRVHFDQFRDALILILSSTLTNEDSFQQPDSSPEAQPKYIKGGKRYGRRSLPEFQTSVEEFAEVTVIEPLNEDEAQTSCLPGDDGCDERWQSQDSEEYEAEGQLRFWNPDDLNASPNISPTQDCIEEKLKEVCENLGISRDGHLSRQKLVSLCEQYGLQNIDTQVLEDVFHNLEHDGTMSVEEFFYRLFKIRKPLPPSASTPYRQLKRHLSMQAFDESGRRTTTPSAMTSTIGFRVFSSLDDGMGYTAVEHILDAWQEEGIESSHEILKALDFSLDGKINLAELTLALENELLVAKNGIYQAALASFKTEIRHWMERADQVVREKEKLRLDLEKAEKLASLMASEVDDHHAAIERRNEYNLSKLDEEYKERVAALKNELQKDREQIQQQASKQQAELEQEVEQLKREENFLRDRLALTLKENGRLERELEETGEKLVKYENMLSKLQKNWESVLAEKFDDLDPGCAEFFLQEERLVQMKNKYERQCRELQDQVDELQSQLEEYRAQGKVVRPLLKNSLYEELNEGGEEGDQEPASEDCNPLNMSIEAEMVIEQMKDQHHRDLGHLQQELENAMCHYEKQLEATKTHYEKEQENLQRRYSEERRTMGQRADRLQAQVAELQGELMAVRQEWTLEKGNLQRRLEEKASLLEHLEAQHERELQARLEGAQEDFSRERSELIQAKAQLEETMRTLAQTIQEEKAQLEEGFHQQLQQLLEKHSLDKEQLLHDLAEKHQQELQERRTKMESEFNGRMSRKEEEFAADRQALVSKYGEAIKVLEERYQQEMRELSELQCELRSQWEFEKDEMVQDGAEAQERWKEKLEKERLVSSALIQEKKLLEKNFKERMNLLVVEKEELEEELCEVKKQAGGLRERLVQIQACHERELRRRGEERSAVEEDRELARQQLGRLEAAFAQEREELNSRLVALERLKGEVLSRAAEEKKELRSKVSRLEGRIQELQHSLHHLSRRQRNLACLEKGELETQGWDSVSPAKLAGTGEGRDVLPNRGEFQVAGGGGGGREIASLSVEGESLRISRGEEAPSPSFLPLVPETLADSQLLSMTEEDNRQTKTGGRIEKPERGGGSLLEMEGIAADESMETSLTLGKAYEEIWEENQVLKAQQSLLLERISLLEAECDQAAHDRQDMASEVQKELEEILRTIPRPLVFPCGSDESKGNFPWETADVADGPAGSERVAPDISQAEINAEELSAGSLPLETEDREASRMEDGALRERMPDPWQVNDGKETHSREQPDVPMLPEELKVENRVLKAEVIKLLERNSKLEGYLPRLVSLQSQLDTRDRESRAWKEEKLQLLERTRELEGAHEQLVLDHAELQNAKLALQSKLGKLEEFVAGLKASKAGRGGESGEGVGKDAEAEKRGLHELNRKLKEKIAALLRQKGTHVREKEDLNVALRGLQSAYGQQQQRLERLRCEAEPLREENAALKNEIALLRDKEKERDGSQEDLWHKIAAVQKEKVAMEKLADNFKKQASELKARNHQLELENARLGHKNSPPQADGQDPNQELMESSALVSSLKMELSQLRIQAQSLEQENHFLKEELEKLKQLPRCPDLSDLQSEISSVLMKNEKLLKERETLSEELNQCMEKVAKTAFLENLVSSMKQEKASLEHHMAESQDKIQSFDDAVQNVNLQMSRLRSDLRRSQQEKEAVEQEVASLHQQLQTAHEKNRVLEVAVHSAGLQSQQKKLCWEELDQLVKQEQQLLRQENERLQREVQSAKSELAHAREKVQQLESSVLALKHQKHLSQSGMAKALEQEKLSLKRECERLQKELTSANRKMLPSSSSAMLSPPPQPPRDLQQQGCAMVSWEQYQRLHHQFRQAERRCQRLQEELESQPLETDMPQNGHEQLFETMEKRMMDVEQQLQLVKRLLQEKVNQLKEQLTKNRKADEMVKDLYVENAQLLKALEMTEQRQKMVEKKNYLLEEKIANLGRIVKNLTSPTTLASAAQLGS